MRARARARRVVRAYSVEAVQASWKQGEDGLFIEGPRGSQAARGGGLEGVGTFCGWRREVIEGKMRRLGSENSEAVGCWENRPRGVMGLEALKYYHSFIAILLGKGILGDKVCRSL